MQQQGLDLIDIIHKGAIATYQIGRASCRERV